MPNLSLAVTKLAAAALVLTVLVFAPISSQAVEVFTEGGNTATGIKDLECGEDVFIDVTFVFDVGTAVYGPPPGEFPYEGLNGATREEGTFALGVCIQNALNAWSEAITRVGPQSLNYFLIAAGADREEPGSPYFYGAFASAYYENPPTDSGPQRPADTWVPADTWSFYIDIQIGGGWPPVALEGDPLPFGAMPPLRTDDTYSWAKIEEAADSPPPPGTIGGTVNLLIGGGLVLQNNGADDLPIDNNGDFTFDTPLATGDPYNVTVLTQPEGQTCEVENGSGEVSDVDVTNVVVSCADVQPRCDGKLVTILGTPGSDDIEGTDGPDVIHGLGSNDTIQGLGGDDVICGGGGSDWIIAGLGNDIVFGQNGDDDIWGGAGDDILLGGDGNDRLKGNSGNDSCFDVPGTGTTGCESFFEEDIPPAPVPKTGQTESSETGDDGDLQMGVTWPDPRFTDNGDGTAKDNLTGLIWLQTAACWAVQPWSDALNASNNLADGQCGLTDESIPGDWRLPNVRELTSLVDYGNVFPPLPTGHPFVDVVPDCKYWSSTHIPGEPGIKQAMDMTYGTTEHEGMSARRCTWPVRGGN